jgi:hypothetical protein
MGAMAQVRAVPSRLFLRVSRRQRLPTAPELLRSPVAGLAVGWAVASVLARPDLYPMAFLAAVAVPLAVAAWRHPVGSLVAMVVALPFLQLVQSWLWTEGILDATTASRFTYVKEVVLGVVLVRAAQHRPAPLPTLDRVAVAFAALTLLYLALPLGPHLEARYVSARATAGFAVVLLAARWLPSTGRLRAGAAPLLLPGAVVMAVLGIWNRWGPEGWTGWVNDVGVLRFRVQVLEATTYGAVERVTDGVGSRIRSGALFFSPNDLGYFMLVAVAIVIARMVQRRSRPWEPAAMVVCMLALYYSGSRSAMGLVALAGIAAATLANRLERRAGAVALTAGVILFLVAGLGAGSLLASGVDSDNESTSQHIDALGEGIVRIATHPLGSGLGTASSNAIRFDVEGRLENSENFYVLVGAQMGVLGAALAVGLVVLILRALAARARAGDGPAVPAAAALAAVAAGGLVLDTLSAIDVSWALGLLAGLALALAPPRDAEA